MALGVFEIALPFWGNAFRAITKCRLNAGRPSQDALNAFSDQGLPR